MLEKSNKKYYTINELAKELNITRQGADKLMKKLNVPYKSIKKENGGKELKLYSSEDIQAMQLQQQQQVALKKNESKATQINQKYTDEQVMLAFGNNLNNKTPDEILAMSFQLYQVAFEKTKDYLEKENKELKIQLDRDMEYYTIKRVSILNNKSQKDYNWRALKNKSLELDLEIKSVPDTNYGIIKSYHIRVWKEVYPNEKYFS